LIHSALAYYQADRAEIDEDISVESLLAGRMSEESPESLQRWLEDRKHGKSRRRASVRANLPR
jgi:hypothetical protein